MLEYYDLFGNRHSKVDKAIEIYRAFEPKEGYYIAFSGGKDSCVILKLAKMAGVKYDAHYNATTVDPKESVRFMIREYPEVIIEKQKIPMRKLIPMKRMPPTRVVRYCCAALKESNGKGRIVVTGVRWAESVARSSRSGLVQLSGKVKNVAEENGAKARESKWGIIMNDDNDAERRTVEQCYRTHKTVINPIIDWTDEDVLEFIHKYHVPYCELYDQGVKRIGCIGCPMGGPEKMKEELDRYPAIKKMYLAAFDEMIELRKRDGLPCTTSGGGKYDWSTPERVLDWWIRSNDTVYPLNGQIEMEYDQLIADGANEPDYDEDGE